MSSFEQMSSSFTQWVWLTVAYRMYFAVSLAVITYDLRMDYVVDTNDTEDDANAQRLDEVHACMEKLLVSLYQSA